MNQQATMLSTDPIPPSVEELKTQTDEIKKLKLSHEEELKNLKLSHKKELKELVDAHKEELKTLQDNLDIKKHELTVLGNSYKTRSETLETETQRVASLKESVDGLKGTLEVRARDVKSLLDDLKILDATKRAYDVQSETLKALQGTHTAQSSLVNSLQSKLDNQAKQLENIQGTCKEATDLVESQNGTIQTLQTNVQTLETRIVTLAEEVDALQIDLESVVTTKEGRTLLRIMTRHSGSDDDVNPIPVESWTVEPSWLADGAPEPPRVTTAPTRFQMVLQLQRLLLDHAYEPALAVTAGLVRDAQRSPGNRNSLRAAFDTLWAAATSTQQSLVVFAVRELGTAIGVVTDASSVGCPLLKMLIAALQQSRGREDVERLLPQNTAREPNMALPVVFSADRVWLGDDQIPCFLLLDLENHTVTSIHRSLGRVVKAPDRRRDRVVMCPTDPGRAITATRNHYDFECWWDEYIDLQGDE